MNHPLIIKNTILINAAAEKVWDALTNPEQTKKNTCLAARLFLTGFPEARLLWKGNYEGDEMVFVKGNIVTIEPNNILAYTVIDPNSTIEDIPENYLTVTYLLSNENGQTLLTVTQGDYFESS